VRWVKRKVIELTTEQRQELEKRLTETGSSTQFFELRWSDDFIEK